MQPSSTRAGMPWLWQGFVFAVLLALIRVIFLIAGHFIHLAVFDFTIDAMINILLVPFLYLVGAVFVGLRASQQTGKMLIGVLAGLATALLTALIYFFASSIYIVVLLNSTGHKVDPLFLFSPSIAFFFLVSMLPALVAGLVGGIIGGAVGSAERRTQSATTTTIGTDTSRRRTDQPPS